MLATRRACVRRDRFVDRAAGRTLFPRTHGDGVSSILVVRKYARGRPNELAHGRC